MKGCSNLNPATLCGRINNLCLRIAYRMGCLCLKSILRPVLSMLRRRWESSKCDSLNSEVPQYGQKFLRRLIFGQKRIELLGSLDESYRKVYELKGEIAARHWYHNELIETLPHLILRAKPWVRAIRLGREKWQLILRKRPLRSSKRQRFVREFYTWNFDRNLTATNALIPFLIVTLSFSIWFMLRSQSHSPYVENKVNTNDERNVSSKNASSAGPTLDSVDRRPRSLGEQRQRQKVPSPKSSTRKPDKSVQFAVLFPSNLVRSSDSRLRRQLSLQPKQTIFELGLNYESKAGPYSLELRDASSRVLAKRKVKRVRNKRIQVVFDMQKFPTSEYYITVSIGNDLLEQYLFWIEVER